MQLAACSHRNRLLVDMMKYLNSQTLLTTTLEWPQPEERFPGEVVDLHLGGLINRIPKVAQVLLCIFIECTHHQERKTRELRLLISPRQRPIPWVYSPFTNKGQGRFRCLVGMRPGYPSSVTFTPHSAQSANQSPPRTPNTHTHRG